MSFQYKYFIFFNHQYNYCHVGYSSQTTTGGVVSPSCPVNNGKGTMLVITYDAVFVYFTHDFV